MNVDAFIPRHERPLVERGEAAQDTIVAVHQEACDALALAALALAALKQSERRRETAQRAVDEMMERLVDFDVRCGAGDVAGAVLALRDWLEAVRR